MGKKMVSRVSLGTFIGMTIAIAASIRNIPNVAGAGWAMFLYMAVGAILFALPICLIAGEFGSTFPENGGPELWIRKTMGDDFGFVTSWLLWVIMFPAEVVIASALPPLIATAINHPELGTSHAFTLIVILVGYWLMTFLNMFFDMAKITGKWGNWVGIYIPLILMTVLGICAIVKTGIQPGSILGPFSVDKLFPHAGYMKSLAFFSPVILIFVGIELSSIYIPRLKKVSYYPIGVLCTLAFMVLGNTVNGFIESGLISGAKINLNNIVQPVIIYNRILGLPSWINNVFSILVAVGVFIQISAWVSGPGKTIVASAREGLFSPKFKFWKTDKFGDSRSVMWVQGIIVSAFACIYLLVPGINAAFLDMVNATNALYCTVYIFMAIGFVRMRTKQPDLPSKFKAGNNFVAWLLSIILVITIIVTLVATFSVGTLSDFIIVAVLSVVLILLPFWFYHIRKTGWQSKVQSLMKDTGSGTN